MVVTGGTAGVGRATARRFAEEGASVGIVAREPQRLERAVDELRRGSGVRATAVEADVADPDAVEAAATTIEERLGPIDVWVNNAMTSVFAPFTEITADEFRRVTEVTYLGCVHGTAAALRRMVPRDRGVVVQVGSALAFRGIPLQSAYCGAKHAIRGFTQSVRTELRHDHSRVRIAIAELPAVNTPQFDWVLSRLPRHAQPVPPIYAPELAAAAICHLARHPRRELWAGASTVGTILAQRLAPAAVDRYLARTGYDSQQTDEPAAGGPANLWEPVPGAFGASGSFGERATDSSPAIWLSTHRGTVTAGAAVLTGAAAWLRSRAS